MSKQPENINFDHFKSQFEEQSNNDLGWNDPPGFVFEDAMAIVNAQKNQENRKNLFVLSSLVLLGLIGGVLLFSHKKVTLLEEKVNLLTVGSLSSDKSTHAVGSSDDTKSLTATEYLTGKATDENYKVNESVSNSLIPDLINELEISTILSAENKIITRSQHNSMRPVKEVLNAGRYDLLSFYL